MRDRCWRRFVKRKIIIRRLKFKNDYTWSTRNGDYNLTKKWTSNIGDSYYHILRINQMTGCHQTRYNEDFKYKRKKWRYSEWFRENI